jgi:hypothetical protein
MVNNELPASKSEDQFWLDVARTMNPDVIREETRVYEGTISDGIDPVQDL